MKSINSGRNARAEYPKFIQRRRTITANRPTRLWAAFALLTLIAMPASSQKFVAAEPVAPNGGPNAPTGYLKLTVSSQLNGLEGMSLSTSRWPWKPKLELLAITVNIDPVVVPASSFLVALYDVKAHKENKSVAVQLGQAQYVTFVSGSPQPALTFRVHAVTEDMAEQFRTAVTAVDNVVTSAPFASLVPMAAQVTAATKVLASFLLPSEQKNPDWVSETKVGLGPGPLSVIPLDGRIAAIFLKPRGRSDALPLAADITQCTADRARLCLHNGQVYSALPYLMLSAEILDYLDLTTLGAPALTCTSTNADVERRVGVIRAGQLTTDQRNLEDALTGRFNLILMVASGALQRDSSAAQLAYAWVRRDDVAQVTPLWGKYGAPRAATFDACFDVEITSRGLEESRRWKIYRDAFQAAASWASIPVRPDSVAQRESFLGAIRGPIDGLGLHDGAGYAMLRDEQARIEEKILPMDLLAVADASAQSTLAGLRAARSALESRRIATKCERCRDALNIAISQADLRIASLSAPSQVAIVAENVVEKGALAEAQQSAKQVAAVAAAVDPGADQSSLRQQASVAEAVLRNPHVPADSVRALAAKIKTSVDSTRATVQKP